MRRKDIIGALIFWKCADEETHVSVAAIGGCNWNNKNHTPLIS